MVEAVKLAMIGAAIIAAGCLFNAAAELMPESDLLDTAAGISLLAGITMLLIGFIGHIVGALL